MVRVVPPMLQGGITAATRDPSGSRESSTGCCPLTSSPRARAILRTANLEVLFGQVRVGNFPQIAGPLNEDASRSVHHDFRDPLVENQMLDGRRNGRISSKPVAA